MTNRTGQFGNVRPLPSGRFQARYRDRSGRDRTGPTTFATRKEAQRFLNEVEIDLRKGTWLDPDKARQPFTEMVRTWRAERPNLRRTTEESYSGILRRHLLPFFGELRADQITPETVRDWHDWMLTKATYSGRSNDDGAPLSPSTIAKAYRLLSGICRTAVDDGALTKNPCRLRGVASDKSPEQRVATAEEVARIANAIDPRYRAMVLIAAYGGLRFGEIIGLRRHRMNFDDNTIRVVEQVTQPDGKTFLVGPPKTDAGVRTVLMPVEVMDEVRSHLDQFADDAGGLVFSAPKGGYVRRSNFYRRAWLPALADAGVEHLRFHDLRHTHATLAVAVGTDTRTLMARMGHASPRAALIYQHAQAQDPMVEGLTRIFETAEARAANDQPSAPLVAAPVGTKLARERLRVVE